MTLFEPPTVKCIYSEAVLVKRQCIHHFNSLCILHISYVLSAHTIITISVEVTTEITHWQLITLQSKLTDFEGGAYVQLLVLTVDGTN